MSEATHAVLTPSLVPGTTAEAAPTPAAGLYRRVSQAMALYADAAWLTTHFGNDRAAAARHLARAYVPELADTLLDWDDLGRVFHRFPEPDDWRMRRNDLGAMEEELFLEGKQRQEGVLQRQQQERCEADRRECRRLVAEVLSVRLLLALRDGTWQRVWDVGHALDAHVPDSLARRRRALDGAADGERVEAQVSEGKRLLRKDTLAAVRRRGLAEVRTGETGDQEIRSTPRQDERFRVDPELEGMLPRSASEVARQEQLLLTEGCRQPLVVWEGQGLLLDGYCRYRLLSLLGWPYQVVEMEFADLAAACRWRWETHYGRHSYTREARSYVRGRRYHATKQRHGGIRRPKGASCQNDHLKGTAEDLAREYGLCSSTICRDGQFAESLDRLAEVCGEEVRRRVLSRELKLTAEDAEWLAGREEAEMKELADKAMKAGKRTWERRDGERQQTISLLLEPEKFVRTLRKRVGEERYWEIHQALTRDGQTRPPVRENECIRET